MTRERERGPFLSIQPGRTDSWQTDKHAGDVTLWLWCCRGDVTVMLQSYKCIYRTAGATDAKRDRDAQRERGRDCHPTESTLKKKQQKKPSIPLDNPNSGRQIARVPLKLLTPWETQAWRERKKSRTIESTSHFHHLSSLKEKSTSKTRWNKSSCLFACLAICPFRTEVERQHGEKRITETPVSQHDSSLNSTATRFRCLGEVGKHSGKCRTPSFFFL